MTITIPPLTAITPETIAAICRAIVAAIHPVKIILFGSQAEGIETKEIIDKSA